MAHAADPEAVAELERRGVLDPGADDAPARERLLEYLLERGADVEEIAAAWEAHGWRGWSTLAVELAMRPEGRLMSLAEAAERTGLDEETLARNWRMLGFPDPRGAGRPFTETEVDVLALRPVTASVIGDDVNDEVARVVGMAMSRIAEAALAAFRVGFELPRRLGGADEVEVAQANAEAAAVVMPIATQMLDVAFRRHLLVAGYREWSPDAASAAITAELAVGFADLEGFTSRSRTLTPSALTAVVNRFEEVVTERATEFGGRVVKLIGDEAMFVAHDPAVVAALAADLLRRFEADDELPAVRIGIEWGSVVTMYGDYYGDAVNLAARLAGSARPSEALLGPALGHRLEEGGDGWTAVPGAPLALKGFDGPVATFRLAPS